MTAINFTTTVQNQNWKIEANGMGYIQFEVYAETEFDEDGCEVEGEEYILIGQLSVAEAHRGQGIGRQLLRAALAMIDEMGMTAKLNAQAGDKQTDEDRLVAFYESEGFWVSDTQGCDGVFMER